MSVCLTFDNLDALAAERFLPRVEAALADHELHATFFCEGVNMEERPEVLERLEAAGHEVAYHAWAHEQWHQLGPREEGENLERGRAAAGGLGLSLLGFRPPGGRLGPQTAHALAAQGFRYCSPAGGRAGLQGGLPMLPFRWRDLDAYCVLPDFSGLREREGDPADGVEPELLEERLLERLGEDVEHMTLLLHPLLLDWFTEERLRTVLGAVEEHVLCRDAAERVEGQAELDEAGWG